MRAGKNLGLTWEDRGNDLNGATTVTDDSNDFVSQIHRVVPCSTVYFVLKLLNTLHSGPFPVAITLSV